MFGRLRRNRHHLELRGGFEAVPDAYGYNDEFLLREGVSFLFGIPQQDNGGRSLQYHDNFVTVGMAFPLWSRSNSSHIRHRRDTERPRQKRR